MSKSDTAKGNTVFHRLYVGTGAFDIIGKRKRFYVFFGVLMLVCIASIGFKQFNLGIDFVGGTKIQLPATGSQGVIGADAVKESFTRAVGREPAAVQAVGAGGTATVQIRTETLDAPTVATLKSALDADLKPTGGVQSISDSAVSASWGGEITFKAMIALIVFLLAVAVFLALYFELSMAMAALVAVVHDVVITAGVYSIVGFEVSPATVIGLLTILGFSLYDTVVVFDKVKENTRGILGLTRRTYAEAANLAVNQTLMRSINTSLIALLPVLGLLVIGVGLLGVGTLKDLALVQLTGIFIGALSSIFIASPIAVDLKMRDPKYQAQAKRVFARRENVARKTVAGHATESGVESESLPSADDEALDAELRKEKAYAAAASVPSRTGKASDARRGRPTGKKRR